MTADAFLNRLGLGYRIEVEVEFSDPKSGRRYALSPDDLLCRFAGYHALRRKLWDSTPVRRRSLRWVPELAAYRLIVPNGSLEEFRQECEGLLSDATEIAAEAGCEQELVVQCLRNLLHAAAIAKERHGNVIVG